jgi:hypothetical protein
MQAGHPYLTATPRVAGSVVMGELHELYIFTTLDPPAKRDRIDRPTLIADPQLAQRLGVCMRTLGRWEKAADFPLAVAINSRKYRRLHELQGWLHRRALASVAALEPQPLRESRARKANRKTA